MSKGLFITFEGGEGSGKSVAVECVYSELAFLGLPVIKIREPGGTEIGEQIRKVILDNNNVAPETEALLFAACRAQNYEEFIKPSLEAGYIILCDRWLTSSMAYQGFARQLNEGHVAMINDFGLKGFRPDREYFLDVPPSIGLERIKKREDHNRMDDEDALFHEAVYKYMKLNSQRLNYCKVIDGTRSPEEVSDAIVSDILSLFSPNK